MLYGHIRVSGRTARKGFRGSAITSAFFFTSFSRRPSYRPPPPSLSYFTVLDGKLTGAFV